MRHTRRFKRLQSGLWGLPTSGVRHKMDQRDEAARNRGMGAFGSMFQGESSGPGTSGGYSLQISGGLPSFGGGPAPMPTPGLPAAGIGGGVGGGVTGVGAGISGAATGAAGAAGGGLGAAFKGWWSGLSAAEKARVAIQGTSGIMAAFRAANPGSSIGGGGALGSGLFPDTPSGAVASQTLLDILTSGGATDPRALNMQLSDISRTTSGVQDAARGAAARSGMGQSGVAQALEAAIGQGGARRRDAAIAAEAQRVEDRKRQDLFSFIQAALQDKGIESGLFQSNAALAQQRDAQKDQILAGLLGLGLNLADRD